MLCAGACRLPAPAASSSRSGMAPQPRCASHSASRASVCGRSSASASARVLQTRASSSWETCSQGAPPALFCSQVFIINSDPFKSSCAAAHAAMHRQPWPQRRFAGSPIETAARPGARLREHSVRVGHQQHAVRLGCTDCRPGGGLRVCLQQDEPAAARASMQAGQAQLSW